MKSSSPKYTLFRVAHMFNYIRSLWLLHVNFASEVMVLPTYLPSFSYTFGVSITWNHLVQSILFSVLGRYMVTCCELCLWGNDVTHLSTFNFLHFWCFNHMKSSSPKYTLFRVAHMFNYIKSLWLLHVSFASEVMVLPTYLPSPSYTSGASITWNHPVQSTLSSE